MSFILNRVSNLRHFFLFAKYTFGFLFWMRKRYPMVVCMTRNYSIRYLAWAITVVVVIGREFLSRECTVG